MLRSPLAGLLVVFALGSCLVGRVAQAQVHEPPPEAMTLFESAREHYRAGDYPEAARDLENALVLDPAAPTLLFNLGRVYELQGDYARSISAYRRLLAVTPPEQTEERQRTQETIDRLAGAQEHEEPPPQEIGDQDEQGPTFVRERGVADDLFWGTFVASGIVGLAAIACGIASLALFETGRQYTLLNPGDDVQRGQLLSDSSSVAVGADVLGSVSLAGFAAALLLFVLREHTYESWDVHAGRSGLELAFHWDGGFL
jgi:tetratricopeptide (TPR) repeat protein